ncbi:redoxin domain-containing protein [Rhizosphaericola mali]|uniref:Redoxin domain-containing protein n=2 Tax=Rhizosphaericola mali TaxID=2545455 RepID=A0A5P2G4Z6_9BACT|nr:redoxin domain-containing protein [Rhizosphaericola mali]
MKFYCTPGNNIIDLKNNSLVLQQTNHYQNDYNNYINILNNHVKIYIDPVLKKYEEVAKTKDSVQIKKIGMEYQQIISDSFEAAKVDYPFIINHPNSPVSLYVLTLVYNNNHLDKIEYLLNSLSPQIQKLPTAVNIKNLIQSARTNAIGKIATNFTLKDTSNNQVSLSDYKGKYVLVDFWASWCAPCRAENPNVVSAYNKFKSKNFTIISVSLDDNRKNWLNAVKNDHLDWAQLSELKGWDGKVSHDYAVTSIPTNYLIDPSGKIIAKNLRGAELDEALTKYL